MEIDLSPDLERFIEERIQSGSFVSPSGVVVAGLRLLSDQGARLEELRSELRKAEDDVIAGRVTHFETTAQILEDIKRLARQTVRAP
jgi:putative addiction module CopG family antidote